MTTTLAPQPQDELSELRARLTALPPTPTTALAEPQTFYRLGERTKLHLRHRCSSVPSRARARLEKVELPYLDAPRERRCESCASWITWELRGWEVRIERTRNLREHLTAILTLLPTLAPSPSRPAPRRGRGAAPAPLAAPQLAELAGLASRLDALLGELRDDIVSLGDTEVEADFTAHLHALTAIARPVRAALTPLLSHIDEGLELQLRVDAFLGLLARRQGQYTITRPRATPGSEVLDASRDYDERGRPFPAIEAAVFDAATSHLLAEASFEGLEAHLRELIAEIVGDEPEDLTQLPGRSPLPLAPFLRGGQLDLRAYNAAAWSHAVAEASERLISSTLDQIRNRIRRIPAPATPVVLALHADASGRYDGLDTDLVLTRFPALASGEYVSFHLVPGLVASWAEAVFSDEAAALGPLHEGETAALLATAASLLDEDEEDLVRAALAALQLARAALA